MKTNKEPEAAAQKPQRLIYCGPNIPGGMLHQFTVFKGGNPEHLGNLFEKCPAIKELIVPVSALNQTKNAVKKLGTEENRLYREVEQFIIKGVR